jgi:hypothetical protein
MLGNISLFTKQDLSIFSISINYGLLRLLIILQYLNNYIKLIGNPYSTITIASQLKNQWLKYAYYVIKVHNTFHGLQSSILYHLKSPPCNEMMTFYLQFLKFDSLSVIV